MRGRGADEGQVARIAVRVKAGASRTAVGGCYPGPLGPALIIAVTAPAVDGRANEATLQALAAALGVRTTDLVLTSGSTARNKVFSLHRPPVGLVERIQVLRDGGTPG